MAGKPGLTKGVRNREPEEERDGARGGGTVPRSNREATEKTGREE
jgi:hypothetical protein